MPQLSIETFVTQYFWLIVVLFAFYFVIATTVIPSIASTFKLRNKLTNASKDSETIEVSETEAGEEWGKYIHVSGAGEIVSTEWKFNNSDWINKVSK